jgi:CheY-like chemotaxis protein
MSSSHQSILLVEDRADDVLLLQRVLKKEKSHRALDVVKTGEEAIAYLDGQGHYADRRAFPCPALVLLDLKLPGISGFEVLAWIRKQPRLNRVRVVVLTASPHSIDIYRACELGADSFLVKPVEPRSLREALKSLAHGWRDCVEPRGRSCEQPAPSLI